jgi:glutamate racemase
VGVLGTQSTIASGAYQRALAELIPGARVTAQPCPQFVTLAEEGWTDPSDEVVRLVARRYLVPVREAGVDAVVLGCTHYPLLAAAIAAELPGVTLVDSAAAIAAEVRERFPGAASGGPAGHAFLVTDTPERFLRVAPRFLGRAVESARHVDV